MPVYDLTVERDHCFFANGILVSNCDAIRTMAEASRQGMLEGASVTAKETRKRPVVTLNQIWHGEVDSTGSLRRRQINVRR